MTREDRLHQALEDIINMQPMWKGGIVKQTATDLWALIEQIRETARDAVYGEHPEDQEVGDESIRHSPTVTTGGVDGSSQQGITPLADKRRQSDPPER